jgi:hypothetical protein
MHPRDSIREFDDFASAEGVVLRSSSVEVGLDMMFSFYETVKLDGSEPDEGDMLLFEWGTYDWGQGENFQVGITRQFIETGKNDDDAISQLTLTYKFEPTAELRRLGAGNRWCDGPTEFDLVRAFALSSDAVKYVAGETPRLVCITHSYV